MEMEWTLTIRSGFLQKRTSQTIAPGTPTTIFTMLYRWFHEPGFLKFDESQWLQMPFKMNEAAHEGAEVITAFTVTPKEPERLPNIKLYYTWIHHCKI